MGWGGKKVGQWVGKTGGNETVSMWEKSLGEKMKERTMNDRGERKKPFIGLRRVGGKISRRRGDTRTHRLKSMRENRR